MILNSLEETSDEKNRIPGVEFKELCTFPDDRGFFREVIRVTDPFFAEGIATQHPFAQWSHSKMAKNTVKAWHFHHRQTDWWYVGIGIARTVLIDYREESPTYKQLLEFNLGDSNETSTALSAVVRIPPGVLHACKVITDTAHLFYITSQTYDPQDEGRIPFNDPDIAYNWGDENSLIVADRDKKPFTPKYSREKIPL